MIPIGYLDLGHLIDTLRLLPQQKVIQDIPKKSVISI